MKRHIRCSIPVLLTLLAMQARGIPAIPHPVTVTLPDNTSRVIHIHGDENFHFLTDADDFQIIEYDSLGFLIPAVREGRRLIKCGSDLELLQNEQLAGDMRRSTARVATLDDYGRTDFPTSLRHMRVLIIPVQFADVKFMAGDPVNLYDRMFNERGYSDYGSAGCAAEYFELSSGGRFSPVFDIAPVVTLPGIQGQYSTQLKWQQGMELILAEADKSVNFSRYDCDNDGQIDNVHFIYAGGGMADSGVFGTIWPHSGTFTLSDLRFDNKRVYNYSCSNEVKGGTADAYRPCGIGAFCHEFCHVLGLPDMYDVNDATGGVSPGQWSVMDAGCHSGNGHNPPLLSGYEQWMLHWLEFTDIEESGHYTLAPLHSPQGQLLRIKCPVADGYHESEYFLAECRPAAGWDYRMPEQGILLWHIDFNAIYWRNNTINRFGYSRINTVRSNLFDNTAVWPSPGVPYQWVWPGETWQFMPQTAPAALFKHTLTGIRFNPGEGTGEFDFNVPLGDTAQVFTDVPSPEIIGWQENDIRLKWSPVVMPHGETPIYVVTVSRPADKLNTQYLKNVCNYVTTDTNLELYSLTDEEWNNEWTLTVRVADVIPAPVGSVIKFIPHDCHYASSVEDIKSAGEAAAEGEPEIYSLDGRRVANGNIAPGIYIVRKGGETSKVVIK